MCLQVVTHTPWCTANSGCYSWVLRIWLMFRVGQNHINTSQCFMQGIHHRYGHIRWHAGSGQPHWCFALHVWLRAATQLCMFGYVHDYVQLRAATCSSACLATCMFGYMLCMFGYVQLWCPSCLAQLALPCLPCQACLALLVLPCLPCPACLALPCSLRHPAGFRVPGLW